MGVFGGDVGNVFRSDSFDFGDELTRQLKVLGFVSATCKQVNLAFKLVLHVSSNYSRFAVHSIACKEGNDPVSADASRE